MKESIIIGLIRNIAILLTFSILYDHFWASRIKSKTLLFKFLAGLFLGTVVIILIFTPWNYDSGIFFDTRSIMLSISGLFFGPIPTVTAMLVSATYRLYLGGSGSIMGVAVILTSGIIGIVWSYLRPEWRIKNNLVELAALGVVVHVVMLACILFLPEDVRLVTFRHIFFSVIILYPGATILLGKYIILQNKVREDRKALEVIEKRWQFALEGAGDGIWDWNPLTNEVYFSKRWKSMLGYEDNEIENKFEEWENRVHPDDLSKVHESINQHVKGDVELYLSEYRLMCKDGSYKWILGSGKIMERDKNGNPTRFIGTHKDISDRKEKELLLAHERFLLDSLMNFTPECIYFKDVDSRFIRVNEATAFYLGCENVTEVIGKSDFDFYESDFAINYYNVEQEIIRTGNSYQKEELIIAKAGDETWRITNKMPLRNSENKIIGTFGLSVNITEHKLIEAELKKSQEQMKKFAAHLQDVREEERVSLAREIHDELGQILIALKIDLGMFKQSILKDVKKTAVENITSKFNQIYMLVDKTINTTRKIMTGLRPEVLELVGFQEAARLYCIEFAERYNTECKFISPKFEITLDSQKSIALFRILQEALTNIAKHAEASEIEVLIALNDNKFIMKVSDNGIGFDENKHVRPDSYGLIGMKERVYLLDGKLTVTGKGGEGTVLLVEMPYIH